MDLSSSGKVAMDKLGSLVYVNYENCLLLLFLERTFSKSSKLQSVWGTDGFKEKAQF